MQFFLSNSIWPTLTDMIFCQNSQFDILNCTLSHKLELLRHLRRHGDPVSWERWMNLEQFSKSDKDNPRHRWITEDGANLSQFPMEPSWGWNASLVPIIFGKAGSTFVSSLEYSELGSSTPSNWKIKKSFFNSSSRQF